MSPARQMLDTYRSVINFDADLLAKIIDALNDSLQRCMSAADGDLSEQYAPGVHQVQNDLVCLGIAQRERLEARNRMKESLQDARLRQHVIEELAEDPHLDPANIRVQAMSGAIVLSGFVTSESQRQAAERDTWWVDTVRAVDNQLVVVFAQDEARESSAG